MGRWILLFGALIPLTAHPARAVQLGDETVDPNHFVVYLFIGHSNMLSSSDTQAIPSAWNYRVPDCSASTPDAWEPAMNPLHQSVNTSCACIDYTWTGPGKPFLEKMTVAHPGYHIGMLQNPNNRASVVLLDTVDNPCWDEVKNRYSKSAGSGSLYDEIVSRAQAIQAEATLGGVVAMLGFMESRNETYANRFASDVVQMVQDMRADLGLTADDLPFFIGQGEFESLHNVPYWETVRAQILDIPSRLANAWVVDPDITLDDYIYVSQGDTGFYDHHYNDQGHDKWAQRLTDIIEDNGLFPVAPTPELGLMPTSLSFSAETAGSAPAAKTVTVANTGTGSLDAISLSISYDGASGWLDVQMNESGGLTLLTNTVDKTTLVAGDYQATISVSCANAINSPQTYSVDLQLAESLVVDSISIAPNGAELEPGMTRDFLASAFDQFGQPIQTAISWSTSGAGSLSATSCPATSTTCGTTLTAGNVIGAFDLTASAGSVSKTVSVEIVPKADFIFTSPASGTVWQTGQQATIAWTPQNVHDVEIRFSLDDGDTWAEIATIDDNDARWAAFPWTVPATPTTVARIALKAYDMSQPVISAAFTIQAAEDDQPPEIHILAPTAGQVFEAGSQTTILFETTSLSQVKLAWSADNGYTWQAVSTISRDANPDTWGAFTWSVPEVSSALCRVRLRSPDDAVEALSGLFEIVVEEPAADGTFRVTGLELEGLLPEDCQGLDTVHIGDQGVPVIDNRFQVTLNLSADTSVFEIASADANGNPTTRLVRLEVTDGPPPIPGLAVAASELIEFLGGKKGVLVWVNAGHQLNVLDFREADPQVVTLSDTHDVVNPLISPDGSRVIYSQGYAGGIKTIRLRDLTSGEETELASGDVGYWLTTEDSEAIVYCDWSDKEKNGADGQTYRQNLVAGTIELAGSAQAIHDRAMDAGPSGDGVWLGQIYANLFAFNTQSGTEYGPDDFFLFEGGPASDKQTCNGSWAPDTTGRLLTLILPHSTVRIFTFQAGSDRFEETSRLQLPAGFGEWGYPEWSRHPDYFSAVIARMSSTTFHLFLIKAATGERVPEVLQLTDSGSVSYSHLYVAP